jgi:phage-related baseplate assembly protein
MANQVEFVAVDLQQIIADVKSQYETETGKVLQPGQLEELMCRTIAYREWVVRNGINAAANQNLVEFATAPVLDYLGELVGVSRLAASPALCTNLFTLVNGHAAVVIPSGLRVGSQDGQVIFVTKNSTSVDASTDEVEIEMECLTTGIAGNGYEIGAIAVVLDPQAYLVSSENIDVTAGGADTESDEALRERIRLAPASFSTAGSRGAYIFHAKSASPAITDVAVDSPTPGLVRVFPLVEGEIVTPAPILSLVELAVNGEKVRPLTDTVEVLSPTKVDYQIEVNLTLFEEAAQQVVIADVTAALQEFADFGGARLGRDRMLNAIVQLCMAVDGVYNVAIAAPLTNLILAANEFGSCTSITVNVVGTNEG